MYIVHSKYKYFIVNIPPTLTRPLDLDNIIPLLPIAAQSGFVNVREPNRLCNQSADWSCWLAVHSTNNKT